MKTKDFLKLLDRENITLSGVDSLYKHADMIMYLEFDDDGAFKETAYNDAAEKTVIGITSGVDDGQPVIVVE